MSDSRLSFGFSRVSHVGNGVLERLLKKRCAGLVPVL